MTNIGGQTRAHFFKSVHKSAKCAVGRINAHFFLLKRRGNTSFVAEGPLEQIQMDLVYMPKSWFNHGFKYIRCCVDVFSKIADMIPLTDREQTTTTKAFENKLDNTD